MKRSTPHTIVHANRPFTVVAIYTDNHQIWVDVVLARDPVDACHHAPGGAVTIAVFEGTRSSLADDGDANGLVEGL